MQLVAQVWLGSVLACVLPLDQDAPLPMPLESAANQWIFEATCEDHEAKGLSWEGHRWCPHCDLAKCFVYHIEANSSTINDPFNWQHHSCSLLPKMHAVGTFCNCPCKYCYSSSQFITICSFGVKTWHWKHQCLWTSFGYFWIRSWPSLSGQRSSGTPRLKTTNLEDPCND